MIVKFNVNCMGYMVGGYNTNFEIEFEDDEFDDMTEEERHDYIIEAVHEHIMERLDFGIVEVTN